MREGGEARVECSKTRKEAVVALSNNEFIILVEKGLLVFIFRLLSYLSDTAVKFHSRFE